jgi:hypothetical protein
LKFGVGKPALDADDDGLGHFVGRSLAHALFAMTTRDSGEFQRRQGAQ